MPFLIEHVIEAVFALFTLLLLGNLLLVGVVIIRRKRRQKFFQRMDALREKYGPVIAGVLSGGMAYEQGLRELREVSGPGSLSMLERLCLEKRPASAEMPVLGRLCEDLGLVKIWQERLAGQTDKTSLREALVDPPGWVLRVRFLSFLIRSKSAENLGLIRHGPSWPLLVKALEDPSPDLQAVAARALAAIRHPGSFPALVERFHKAVLDPAPVLSVRTLKSALVSFPLQSACGLAVSLRHTNPRIRFLAADVIREMVEREAGGNPDFCLDQENGNAELAALFLTKLAFDVNPDVRAQAAHVIVCLPDPRSGPVLVGLLKDSVWFVRLHAVRSLSKPKFASHAGWVAKALTDSNWRVREAAVRALRAFGPAGLDELTGRFLETRDRYSQEQIAEEFQRAGLIPQLLARCAEKGRNREAAVLSRLVEMGKTSYIISLLDLGEGNAALHKEFLRKLGQKAVPQILHWLQPVALPASGSGARSQAPSTLAPKRPHGKG
ncbi:MAG: HEAT repeat domain-containing protein [Acidobacteriota bacterium]